MKDQKVILIIVGCIAGAVAIVSLVGSLRSAPPVEVVVPPKGEEAVVGAASPLDATYKFGPASVTLTGGVAEREIAPGSASKEVTRVFGEPVAADLDGDGDMDAALYLTQEGGGSGTFFYIALAINKDGKYVGTNAMPLGDRIAPQNINIDEGRAVANFAVRKPGEPFTAQPSMGKSVWVQYDKTSGTIGEFVKGFEGEADTSRMTLSMKTWNWQRTDYTDGKVVTPNKENVFGLTFKDGSVSAKTDCNSIGGSYTTKGSELTFGPMMSTLMYCEGSQESEFSSALGEVGSFKFTSRGQLILELKSGKGTMTFN